MGERKEEANVSIYPPSDIDDYQFDDQMHFIFIVRDKTVVFIRMMLFSFIILWHN